MIISRSVRLTMRNVSDDICRENQTHILWSIHLFVYWGGGGDHRAVYELIWKNIVELDQYGACALHAGRLSLRTPAQNM